jgi:histone deacetylase 1/2
MQRFQPGAVVMCCGADSITGDRLGCWNLSIKGHGAAIEFVKSFGVPVILLGGGGYTPRNVARCWAYETAIALGEQGEMGDDIPWNQYHNYFGPNHQLHLAPDPNMKNMNSKPYLDKYLNIILDNLNQLDIAPSVQFQDVPPDFSDPAERAREARDNADGDEREGDDMGRRHQGEYYEDDKDQDSGAGRGRSHVSSAPSSAGLNGGAGKVRAPPRPQPQDVDQDEGSSSKGEYAKGTECGGFAGQSEPPTP